MRGRAHHSAQGAGMSTPKTARRDFDTASPQAAILTVAEAARELRCSKAHVHHLIAGSVRGVRPLPSLWLGRRRLILRATFDEWVASVEKFTDPRGSAICNEREGA